MTTRFTGWLAVGAAVVLQFLLEVTFGRLLVAPAVLVPVLVYLSLNYSDYWAVEGALWSGFAMDFLLHQPVGAASVSMLSGIALANWLLRSTTGVAETVFVLNAILASVFSDLIFVFLVSRPFGSWFGLNTLLVFPRALVPVLVYLAFVVLLERVRGRR